MLLTHSISNSEKEIKAQIYRMTQLENQRMVWVGGDLSTPWHEQGHFPLGHCLSPMWTFPIPRNIFRERDPLPMESCAGCPSCKLCFWQKRIEAWRSLEWVRKGHHSCEKEASLKQYLFPDIIFWSSNRVCSSCSLSPSWSCTDPLVGLLSWEAVYPTDREAFFHGYCH